METVIVYGTAVYARVVRSKTRMILWQYDWTSPLDLDLTLTYTHTPFKHFAVVVGSPGLN